VRHFRKHLKRYLLPVPLDPEEQYQLLTCDDYHDLRERIHSIFDRDHIQVYPEKNVLSPLA
jgi:hypothetical protein